MTYGRPRVRDLGIKIGSLPTGSLNAITDIAGIKVGQVTLIDGKGKLVPGKGPIRTGITVIFPHAGDTYLDRVVGAFEWFNGFGECFGTAVMNEFGYIAGPIVLTNSFNVYRVADALEDWSIQQHPEVGKKYAGLICLVTECSDDYLNDIQGRHVHRDHVFQALQEAKGGMPEEGSVGAGTGGVTFEFKAGIGTSSRVLSKKLGGFKVGAMVQTNFGIREQLRIDGVPIGKEIRIQKPPQTKTQSEGSCVNVIATNAPLSSRQLRRLARRAFLGQARTGGTGRNGSGDLAIAFSTTNRVHRDPNPKSLYQVSKLVPDAQEDTINALFQAATDAVEEAILNSIFKADTMIGRDNNVAKGLPINKVVDLMHEYGYPTVHLPKGFKTTK